MFKDWRIGKVMSGTTSRGPSDRREGGAPSPVTHGATLGQFPSGPDCDLSAVHCDDLLHKGDIMGQARGRGSREQRVAQAQERAAALRPRVLVCGNCETEVTEFQALDHRGMVGVTAAYGGICPSCHHMVVAAAGDKEAVARVLEYFALTSTAGGEVILDSQPKHGLATCIGCGCTDRRACVTDGGPCHWLKVDYPAGVGVCSECGEHLARYEAGDRAVRHRTLGEPLGQ